MKKLKAAIEAGGTKWIVAIGYENGEVLEERVLPIESPNELLAKVVDAIKNMQSKWGSIDGLGIGSFGPIIINPDSPDYGRYINTPKEGWSDFNLIKPLRQGLGNDIDIYLDTDVNTAVYAEYIQGVGKGKDNVCYVTVGTGIGGGAIINGQIVKGRMHPEMGHLIIQESTLEKSTAFTVCPYHINCVEGKASGTAMAKRWDVTPDQMPNEAWRLEADYLAQMAVSLTAVYSPDVIIFGGGVMKKDGLISRIRQRFVELAGGYWVLPEVKKYICLTSFDDRAGLVGALLLA